MSFGILVFNIICILGIKSIDSLNTTQISMNITSFIPPKSVLILNNNDTNTDDGYIITNNYVENTLQELLNDMDKAVKDIKQSNKKTNNSLKQLLSKNS
mmetsp:Transcript_78348/g.95878  ORF Transcript_78348/g.95878 Transcript_78348/m.95878 type:complete len:99 (+) Transcript_78348:46-342(+)